MKKAMIGYQIYSAREDAEKDLFGTLKKIAEMGYDGVEFAGFYHYTVDEIKKALEEKRPCGHLGARAAGRNRKGYVQNHFRL